MQRQSKIDAAWPSRFDHRFIRKVLDLSEFSGPVSVEEYELLARVFKGVGGSWQRIIKGSPEDIHMLKTIVKYAIKKKHLVKKNEGV